ncbi:hypothetical protein [Catenulispora subtropica]|uniref:hypothetical protein n=1 Tax=Catenulispora subtropica TaxID=450798 RepID=UPI0031E1C7BC
MFAWDRRAALGWRNLLSQALDSLDRAWVAITADPRGVSGRQRRLEGSLGLVKIHGADREQWQYEVTSGGRIWYAIDDDRRTLWITHAGTGHPKQTDTRGGRP